MTIRRPFLALAALSLAAGASPAGARIELGAPAAEADVTIGCMFPMTGRSAIYGKDSVGASGWRSSGSPPRAARGRTPRLRVLVDDYGSKVSNAVRLAEDYIRRDRAASSAAW